MPSNPFARHHQESPGGEKKRSISWLNKFKRHSKPENSSNYKAVHAQESHLVLVRGDSAAVAHNEQASHITVSSPTRNSSSLQANDGIQPTDTDVDEFKDADADNDKDVWSAAYRKAVLSCDEKVQDIISKDIMMKNLLENLHKTNEELQNESFFRRGAHSLQLPLKYIRAVVDTVGPLTQFEPIAATAVGMVSCVTATAIGICGAEESLNAKIKVMLDKIEVIDECDKLGDRFNDEDTIQKGLIPVYKDLLRFYAVASEILASRLFVIALIRDQISERLPGIVEDFIEHADSLKLWISKATVKLLEDVNKSLLEEKIRSLLGADKHKQQSGKHDILGKSIAFSACEWIINDAQFCRWYHAKESEQLVLCGHMGCGKTAMTAYVIEELINKNQTPPKSLICYYYCQSGEIGKTLSVYSCLILQLLKQREDFMVQFDEWLKNPANSEYLDPAQSTEKLGKFLKKLILGLNRKVFIIIDALDECDDDSQEELADFFRDVLGKAWQLKVFYTARAQGGMQNSLQKASVITWRPTRERDDLLVKHVVERNLKNISLEMKDLVIGKLSESAQGSAIWVQMIIELIKKRKQFMAKSVHPMQTFLASIPTPKQLSKTYAALFVHQVCDDLDNELFIKTALEILAIAKRPFTIKEFGWALALHQSSSAEQSVEKLEEFIEEERALRLLQPFLPQIDENDHKRRQVTLVHYSLKELILQEAPSKRWGEEKNELKNQKAIQKHAEQRQKDLEGFMMQICIKYLLLKEIDDCELFSEEQIAFQEWEALPGIENLNEAEWSEKESTSKPYEESDKDKDDEATIYNPTERGFGDFFVYSSCYWLDHLRSASDDVINIPEILRICSLGSKRFRNWTSQVCRPDCTIMPKFEVESLYVNSLCVMSLYGSEAALKRLLSHKGVDFDIYCVKRCRNLIIHYGDISRLCILFRDERFGSYIRDIGVFQLMMHQWSLVGKETSRWECGFNLIYDIVDDVLIQEKWGNELLCQAASSGCLPLVERLFKEAARKPALMVEILRDTKRDWRNSHSRCHQSVGEAIWNDHIDVLRYLLAQKGIEAHLNHRDSAGNNVFHKASRCCNPQVISLLIERFPEGVDEGNNEEDTPLQALAFRGVSASGRLDSAKVLLIQGKADARAGRTEEPPNWLEPFRIATRHADIDMCRLLVEVGGLNPRLYLNLEGSSPSLMDEPPFPELAQMMLKGICLLAGIEHFPDDNQKSST